MRKEVLKEMMRKNMESLAMEAYNDNSMQGSPFEGFIIKHAIGTACKNYKEQFILEKNKLGLSEQEINDMVDDVATEILDKFLE